MPRSSALVAEAASPQSEVAILQTGARWFDLPKSNFLQTTVTGDTCVDVLGVEVAEDTIVSESPVGDTCCPPRSSSTSADDLNHNLLQMVSLTPSMGTDVAW